MQTINQILLNLIREGREKGYMAHTLKGIIPQQCIDMFGGDVRRKMRHSVEKSQAVITC